MRIKKTLSHQWLRTWPRFETEAWDNLEMAYCNWFKIGANFLTNQRARENKKGKGTANTLQATITN